jgi:hypothetical protein
MKIFKENMDSEVYAEILYRYLIPFTSSSDISFNLHQDNDTKHSSKLCTEILKKFNIPWVN